LNSISQPPILENKSTGRAHLASHNALLLFPAGLLALAAALILFLFNPVQSRFYPVCVFHQMTGLHCPGCGCLRAMHQLLHGNLEAAFHYNALLIVMLPFLLAQGVRVALAWAGVRQAPAVKSAWLWVGFMALLLFGVLRNLPLDCFRWMAP
jgi:hypothetical protein